MATKDELDELIDDFADADPTIRARVDAAVQRRELARRLAARRRKAGITQAEVARRMGTSQGQVTRLESGADTRLSTVSRYAAAVGLRVGWTLTPVGNAPNSGRPVVRKPARRRAAI